MLQKSSEDIRHENSVIIAAIVLIFRQIQVSPWKPWGKESSPSSTLSVLFLVVGNPVYSTAKPAMGLTPFLRLEGFPCSKQSKEKRTELYICVKSHRQTWLSKCSRVPMSRKKDCGKLNSIPLGTERQGKKLDLEKRHYKKIVYMRRRLHAETCIGHEHMHVHT